MVELIFLLSKLEIEIGTFCVGYKLSNDQMYNGWVFGI